MLKQTFCHIDGISEQGELLIWKYQLPDWETFLSHEEIRMNLPFSERKLRAIDAELQFSLEHLFSRNLSFFKERLPQKELWRLIPHGKIGYVDIETTGLSKWSDQITMIGIYDNTGHRWYLNGENLHDAKEDLLSFDIIVSFNGKQFDIPFIEHHLSMSCAHQIHLDLRYLLKEFGYRGGLKRIEEELGISRQDEVSDIDGREAVRLWKQYQKGDSEALGLLLRYNEEDTKNLMTLLELYRSWKEDAINEQLREIRTEH